MEKSCPEKSVSQTVNRKWKMEIQNRNGDENESRNGNKERERK